MRTTLTIDDDVLDVAREIATADGRSLGSIVSDLARSRITFRATVIHLLA